LESIEILKGSKTPFVIAANKIDLIPGYKQKDKMLLKNLNNQDPYVQEHTETKIYEIVGKLSELGMNSERFDRVEDYTKEVAIIPVSAITGDGIPELLMVLIGLAQKYLEENLKLHVKGNAKGSVIEVKEATGLGTTLDVIIYDGVLKRGDKIMIGGLNKPIETRVKALLCPMPLKEMRDKKTKFKTFKEITAATGVKISAPDIDKVIAGMPIQSYNPETKDKVEEEIQKQVNEVIVETEESGVIIKADTLGSLEALTFLLREKNVPVRKASIGKITKKDIADAESNYDKTPLFSVILGFNVDRENDVSGSEKAKIITSDIIYKIIEEYGEWAEQKKRILEAKKLDELIRPCKIQVMPNYVFRQSGPAICGCDIVEGKLTTGTRLMKDNKPITSVKSIQKEKENIKSITKGHQVAVSMDSITIGRQVNDL
jgi:translation initiation factor 5B